MGETKPIGGRETLDDRRRGTDWKMSGPGARSSAEEIDISEGSGAIVFSRLRLSYTSIGLIFSVGGIGESPKSGTSDITVDVS